jgi:NAD(P)-dependent dehydrogenase (short-subunit alcohol dehydrogenase family)
MAIALVTGTSTGIGLATAITLGRAGHTVYAGMRNLERASDLKAIIAKEQLPVAVVQLDVDDDGSVSSAIRQVLEERGRIDVLVNNAGIGGGGPVEEVAIDVFRKIIETNFFGGLRCIKAVVPGMRERRSGCIINVSPLLAVLGHRRKVHMQPRSGLLKV